MCLTDLGDTEIRFTATSRPPRHLGTKYVEQSLLTLSLHLRVLCVSVVRHFTTETQRTR